MKHIKLLNIKNSIDMKKILLSIIGIIACGAMFAQSPNAFSYQAVARASNGDLITGQAVSFKLSILQDSTSGTSVYSETHSATTNKYGLVNLQIGNGSTGGDFTAINWANGPYFVKVEMDATGGTTYAEMGTSQLLSVPFAKYADIAGNVEQQVLSISNDTIYLTNGGFVKLPAAHSGTNTDDQQLSISNDTVLLEDGGFVSGIVTKTLLNDSIAAVRNDIPTGGGSSSLPQYTQDEIDALSPIAGMLVYNTDYGMLQFYNGSQWSGSQSSGCVPKPNTSNLETHKGALTTTIDLSGTEPAPGIRGKWEIVKGTGGSFGADTLYNTAFTGINDSVYTVKWSLFSSCDTSSDEMTISVGMQKIDFNGTLYIYPEDNSTGIQWYNGSYITTNATSITDGAANTDSIVKYQGAGAYAAYLCDTLTAFGHNDWYLPAKDELNAMYQNKATIGGFSSDDYWSSTDLTSIAWSQAFSDGTQDYGDKVDGYRVRCVRRD